MKNRNNYFILLLLQTESARDERFFFPRRWGAPAKSKYCGFIFSTSVAPWQVRPNKSKCNSASKQKFSDISNPSLLWSFIIFAQRFGLSWCSQDFWQPCRLHEDLAHNWDDAGYAQDDNPTQDWFFFFGKPHLIWWWLIFRIEPTLDLLCTAYVQRSWTTVLKFACREDSLVGITA